MYTDVQGRRWFKGNLHTHTTESDGKLSPEDCYALYKAKGYDFLARTDHWKVSDPGEYEGMLLLSGCEYNFGDDPGTQGVYHIVALGMERDPQLPRSASPDEAVRVIHENGGLANIAHPAWSLNSPDQILRYGEIFDMTEIYNSVSGLPRNARPYSGLIVDMVASRGYMLPLIADDDVHFYVPGYDACRSFIMVEAESCTRESILDAITKKRFYATQGPELYVTVADGKIIVDCSPVCEIVYFSNMVWNDHRADTCPVGERLTHGEYAPHPNDRFIRVEVRDAAGNMAWSQIITRAEWSV